MPGNPLEGRDAVLLGLDGVLFRTDAIHAQSYRLVLGPLGIADFEYARYAGMSAREVIQADLERHDIVTTAAELRRLTAEKREDCFRLALLSPRLIEGAREFLADASAAGYRIAIVTGGFHERVFAMLEAAKLDPWIDTVVTLRSGAHPKPAPDLYLEALRRLSVAADRAVAIEDAGVGIRAARAAGVDPLAIVTGEIGKINTLPHDVPLTSFPDLNEYVCRRSASLT